MTADEPKVDRTRTRDSGDAQSGGSTRSGTGTELNLFGILNTFLRWRWLVVGTMIAGALALTILALLAPATYTAEASFTPEAEASPESRLTGLASQFGISIPAGPRSRSPRFYADLLTSRRILGAVARTEFELPLDPPSGDSTRTLHLADLYSVEAERPDKRHAAVIGKLKTDITSIIRKPETGVVELSVSTRWPSLSEQILRQLLESIHEFNINTRQSQAQEEREFVSERLDEARAELQSAEDSLEQFLERNRRYQNSPQLTLRYQRLQRLVERKQQVHTSLAQSYAQARINEVRDTPVITVVDPPQLPPGPDPRHLPIKFVLGAALGAAGGTAIAFLLDLFATLRREDRRGYAEFRRLMASLRDEIDSTWTRLRPKS